MGALICFAGEISKWWTSVDVEMACFANHPALTRNDFPNPDYRKITCDTGERCNEERTMGSKEKMHEEA
jgi:hypothetical protein